MSFYIFYRSQNVLCWPNILSQPKNLTAFTLVPLQKLVCWHKNQFYWMQTIFLSGTKGLWLPQYVNKFLVWHKKFGPAQNILGPVKGQGIRENVQNYQNYLQWISSQGWDYLESLNNESQPHHFASTLLQQTEVFLDVPIDEFFAALTHFALSTISRKKPFHCLRTWKL